MVRRRFYNNYEPNQKSFLFFLHQWRKKKTYINITTTITNNKKTIIDWKRIYLVSLIRFWEILGRKVVAKFKNLIKILKILNWLGSKSMNTHMRFLTIEAGISSKLYYDMINEITGRFTNVVSILKTRRLRETIIKKRERRNQLQV